MGFKNSFSSVLHFSTSSTQSVQNIDVFPLFEQNRYTFSLYQTTLFPHEHTHRFSSLESMTLSFRFRSIEFNKKRSLLFFLTLELLSNKKAIASLSSRNIQS